MAMNFRVRAIIEEVQVCTVSSVPCYISGTSVLLQNAVRKEYVDEETGASVDNTYSV
jgi:hypothetical protein